MLVALLEEERIVAAEAERGPVYRCPLCRSAVTLRKGDVVVHHFAHRPPTTCGAATGETLPHMQAKTLFYRHFKAKGYPTAMEVPIFGDIVRLRADVLTEPRPEVRIAFEIQHTPISLEEIAGRTAAYFRLGIAVCWLPILRARNYGFEKTAGGLFLERYRARPFEIWINGLGSGVLWFFDPDLQKLWQGRLDPRQVHLPPEWRYDQSTGGTMETTSDLESKRWRCLRLAGPFGLETVQFRTRRREASRAGALIYPAGRIVVIEPAAG